MKPSRCPRCIPPPPRRSSCGAPSAPSPSGPSRGPRASRRPPPCLPARRPSLRRSPRPRCGSIPAIRRRVAAPHAVDLGGYLNPRWGPAALPPSGWAPPPMALTRRPSLPRPSSPREPASPPPSATSKAFPWASPPLPSPPEHTAYEPGRRPPPTPGAVDGHVAKQSNDTEYPPYGWPQAENNYEIFPNEWDIFNYSLASEQYMGMLRIWMFYMQRICNTTKPTSIYNNWRANICTIIHKCV